MAFSCDMRAGVLHVSMCTCVCLDGLPVTNRDVSVVKSLCTIPPKNKRCGHCKSMKPAWDKLMGEFKGHKDVLIGDCDCTGDCKSLCEEIGVQGYPT